MSARIPPVAGRAPREAISAQLPLELGWDDGADLALFVPGADGEALAATEALVGGELSPLVLHGRAGTGKSHLLQAACTEVGARGGRAVYLPLRSFIRHSPDFCEGLEVMDLVAIDDGDRLQGQPGWQEALFHLYNRALQNGAALGFASRVRPDRLEGLLPDLASRLRSGLVLSLAGLDDDGRLEALTRRARRRGLDLPEAVGRYLLTRYSRETGDLFRCLNHLDAASLERGRALTIPFVRDVLGEGG